MTQLDKQVKKAEQAEDEKAFRWIVTREPAVFAALFFDLELDQYQVDLLNHARNNRRSLILLPKGHGKSTLVSKILPILELCTNPNVRIILIMKTQEESAAYSSTIRNELMENKQLISTFGQFHNPLSWSNQTFNIKQRQITDPHYSLEIYGEKGRYLGHRSDITICDDIVTEENSYTRDGREKLKAKFETGIQTGPQYMWTLANANCKWEESSSKLRIPKGIYWPTDINYERIIVCGTRFHPQDLYNKLEHDASYKNLYFDCWTDGEMTKPLWPKMWTKQKLDAEKKSLGTLSFNKRYRNIALDESELGFRHEWFYGGERDGEVFAGCLNNGRSWGEHSDKWYKAVGFDPASGSTSRFSTFPSFVCAGIDKDDPREDKPRYLIDIFRQQTGFDDLIDVMLDGKPGKLPGFRRLYDYDLLVVEANAYGTYFIDNNRIKRAQTLGLRVEPHYTGRNKTDPTDGVMSMQGIVKQGLLDIPYKTDADKRKTDDFLEQWLIFPKGIYDYLMAFWFVELKFRQSLSKRKAHVKSNPYKFGRISNPFYSRRPSGTP